LASEAEGFSWFSVYRRKFVASAKINLAHYVKTDSILYYGKMLLWLRLFMGTAMLRRDAARQEVGAAETGWRAMPALGENGVWVLPKFLRVWKHH